MHTEKRQTMLSDETRKEDKDAVGDKENLNNIREGVISNRVEGSFIVLSSSFGVARGREGRKT